MILYLCLKSLHLYPVRQLKYQVLPRENLKWLRQSFLNKSKLEQPFQITTISPDKTRLALILIWWGSHPKLGNSQFGSPSKYRVKAKKDPRTLCFGQLVENGDSCRGHVVNTWIQLRRQRDSSFFSVSLETTLTFNGEWLLFLACSCFISPLHPILLPDFGLLLSIWNGCLNLVSVPLHPGFS